MENWPLQTLAVEPWLEDRELISSTPGADGRPRNCVASSRFEGATLRYTTDGAEPMVASPACAAPLTFTRSTTLRLRAFSDDGTVFGPMAATYTGAELRDAADPGPLSPGICYERFEGE